MTPAARVAAAIEALADIFDRRRPASDALKDWGLAHRFAGSKDRAAIAALVHDALRRKASAQWIVGAQTARAAALGSLALVRGLDADAIAALCEGPHAPAPLSDDERARLAAADLADAPEWVAGDFPEWLAPHLAATFGDDTVAEARALSARAPVDLRVDVARGTRDAAAAKLAHLLPAPTPHSPWGLRIAPAADGRPVPLAAEPAYVKGLVEVQDEASQLAVLLAGAKPGMQVVDLCAGAGGKSLALAAAMGGKGQVFATDSDGRRLAPIHARIERAHARNVQVRSPRGAADPVADLAGRGDLVFVDAPCTGIGAWRRNPDAKWRVRPGALEQRIGDQRETLARAAGLVKRGGRLVYATCSLLRVENEDATAAFLAAHPDFLPLDAAKLAADAGVPALGQYAAPHGAGFLFSPRRTGTDGFYVAAFARMG
ncbi:MAG: RsmB/NOP family class I SAM-dependent RNA methyltransferase [Hyphomicrobiales bacterium]|nr:RsmB/NOP family class I SAM-dependent RNA methyltransferase [Hyphomicrobiales bacterium]